MGILSRFKDIMSANLNSLLDNAEGKNADKLLENYVRQAKEDLETVKAETAGVMADETGAKRKVDEIDAQIAKMDKYAAQAVQAGNDDDARKFLAEKASLKTQKADADKVYQAAKANADRMRALTDKLMDDINSADSKLAELKSKLAVAKQTEHMNQMADKIGHMTGSTAIDTNYDRLEDAVQKRIDQADAMAKLNDQIGDSDVDDLMDKYDSTGEGNPDVDDELAALKAKLGK